MMFERFSVRLGKGLLIRALSKSSLKKSGRANEAGNSTFDVISDALIGGGYLDVRRVEEGGPVTSKT
jgi:hypothetical protein